MAPSFGRQSEDEAKAGTSSRSHRAKEVEAVFSSSFLFPKKKERLVESDHLRNRSDTSDIEPPGIEIKPPRVIL